MPVKENDIPDKTDIGVLKNEWIETEAKKEEQVTKNHASRRIAYWVEEHRQCYEFITNSKEMNAGHIAVIY